MANAKRLAFEKLVSVKTKLSVKHQSYCSTEVDDESACTCGAEENIALIRLIDEALDALFDE